MLRALSGVQTSIPPFQSQALPDSKAVSIRNVGHAPQIRPALSSLQKQRFLLIHQNELTLMLPSK